MAVWQFTVVLIPESWAEMNRFDSGLLFDDLGYDTTIAWASTPPGDDLVKVLSEVLPLSESWHRDLLTWGDAKGNDIQVWREGETIDGVHIRISTNKNWGDFSATVTAAARKLSCVFFIPERRKIVPADEVELRAALISSEAAKFSTGTHHTSKQ